MSILEIIWILFTLLTLWVVVRLIIEKCEDAAFPFIIILIVNISFMALYWTSEL